LNDPHQLTRNRHVDSLAAKTHAPW
jgi:hypothetical protein